MGRFLPDTGLPRRMWAGGRIEFRHPLRVGDPVRRDSEIIAVEPKDGRTGRLVFVTVRHTVSANERVAVVEEHDIVYRQAPLPGDAPPVQQSAPLQSAWRRELVADPVMLFRFSALMFIGHRIHYDIDYCRQEEGYPGLLVHGPLQTVLLWISAGGTPPGLFRKSITGQFTRYFISSAFPSAASPLTTVRLPSCGRPMPPATTGCGQLSVSYEMMDCARRPGPRPVRFV